jgi:putative ABC transport system permease protein
MSELLQDLKFGIRALWKSPGFSIAALLTMAIGIGANAAIFSFVDGAILKPLPYPEPDGLVCLCSLKPDHSWNYISSLDFLDWQKRNKVFKYLAAYTWENPALTGIGEPVLLHGLAVSAHYLDILGIKTALGRTFVEGEDQIGQNHVVVLSNSLWTSRFGADPGIIGKSITLDGEANTVIGVLAKGNPLERGYDQFWQPLAFTPKNLTRDLHMLLAFGRLKPGVTWKQAQTQMEAVAISIAHDYPKSDKGWGIAVWPIAWNIGGDFTKSLYVLMAAVGMVLLIACANLANLTLARGIAREREVAIRTALGASRWRLVRQLLSESLSLSFAGGALGLLVAYGGIAAIKAAMPAYWLPMEAVVEMDGRILLFTLGLSALTGLVFGLVPALKASHPNLTNAIKQGGVGSSTGRSRNVLRSLLVVTEVALACTLLSGAGLLIRSFFELRRADLGFDPTNVVTAWLPITEKRYPSAERCNLYRHQLLDRVGSLPGVRDVALTSALPMYGQGWGMPFEIAGPKSVDVANRPWCFVKMVSPSYFHALGIRLIKGRSLSERDVKGAPLAAVINQAMAKKFFQNGDPVGRHILMQEIQYAKDQFGPDVSWEVVGVMSDEQVQGLSDRNDNNSGTNDKAGIYVTNDQCPQMIQALVVRGTIAPSVLQRSIANAVHEIDKDQVLEQMTTLEQIKSNSLGYDRLRSSLVSIFASVALLLSAIGLYGVISYSVVQRTREIGIRTALGADSKNILILIVRSGMTLTGIGLLIGIGGALALSQILSSMLFNIGKYDPTTMVAVAGILIIMALLACLIPARRATRVDPMVSLRCE